MKIGTLILFASAFMLLFAHCTESIEEPQGDLDLSHNSQLFLKKKDKCTICHYQADNDAYKKKEVSCGSGLEEHLAHGDGVIHGPVPGQEGFVFGGECQLIQTVTCPCFTRAEVEVLVTSETTICDTESAVTLQNGFQQIVIQFLDFGDENLNYHCSFAPDFLPTDPAQSEACANILRQIAADLGVPAGDRCR